MRVRFVTTGIELRVSPDCGARLCAEGKAVPLAEIYTETATTHVYRTATTRPNRGTV